MRLSNRHRTNIDRKNGLNLHRIARSVLFCGLIALPPAGYLNAQTAAPAEWHKSILNEIAALRSDLLEFLMESQRKEILNLEHELEQVRRQQTHVQDQERQRGDQISQIEQQLLSPDLEPEARPQIEATKGQLISEDAEKLRIAQAKLTQRERDISQQLEQEMRREQRLEQKVRSLQTASQR